MTPPFDPEKEYQLKPETGCHAGDCAIYARLINGNPEDGICTCGYAHRKRRSTGNPFCLYSRELRLKLALNARG